MSRKTAIILALVCAVFAYTLIQKTEQVGLSINKANSQQLQMLQSAE